jgi:glycosyltransferase involved in cell wall biosynthesis
MRDPRWSQVVLLQPFTTYSPHVAYLENVVSHVDKFAAITGKYWSKQLEISPYVRWKSRFFPVELAVDTKDFPHLKSTFNTKGRRKFLYIGNSDPCKNLQYLELIAKRVGVASFGTIGAQVPDIKCHGRLDFSLAPSKEIVAAYDFLIMTSFADANPTVVLEAMAWGLLPICTPQCGYTEADGVIPIPSNDAEKAASMLKTLNYTDNQFLLNSQMRNQDLIRRVFSWEQFCGRIQEIVELPVSRENSIVPDRSQILTEIFSNRFFLRPANLMEYIRENL